MVPDDSWFSLHHVSRRSRGRAPKPGAYGTRAAHGVAPAIQSGCEARNPERAIHDVEDPAALPDPASVPRAIGGKPRYAPLPIPSLSGSDRASPPK